MDKPPKERFGRNPINLQFFATRRVHCIEQLASQSFSLTAANPALELDILTPLLRARNSSSSLCDRNLLDLGVHDCLAGIVKWNGFLLEHRYYV